jgi:hypothetical protein
MGAKNTLAAVDAEHVEQVAGQHYGRRCSVDKGT